ncbi:ABC transporter ATP-binding protein [Paenibacillus thermotolerans]|uniref:ABC transporter ATP-binding protein n=1 Tax=Paenibacillus thermotolerans TaxID=3027807 RepID=UPI0023675235|nr:MULTISPECIES: ABC transporter ATP-binding protein [unclassified Paenibacillus]
MVQVNGERPEVPVLSVQRLAKSIKGKEIIKGVSFNVYAGEIFGFLGPNGSGKTTTIRMLVDLIRPTAGKVVICGADIRKDHDGALKHVGCIVENPELYPYLTGWENLEHFAGMLQGVDGRRIRETVELVGMGKRIHDKVKTYSLGMRQRLGIAQALLGNPKLLILDEPTNGLDPQGIKELREFVRKLADQGMSVFISSHLLSEIEWMCDRVAIISKGALISEGRVDELLRRAKQLVHWQLEPVELGLSVLMERFGGDVEADSAEGRLSARMDEETIPEANRQLVLAGVRVKRIEIKQPTLEQLFLDITEGESIE